MQVKDYLQALSDDNKIRVEKIGSGNWYWSFPSDEQKARQAELEKAQDEYNKVAVFVADLQAKVEDAGAARGEDDGILVGSGRAPVFVLLNGSSCVVRRRPQGTHTATCGPD